MVLGAVRLHNTALSLITDLCLCLYPIKCYIFPHLEGLLQLPSTSISSILSHYLHSKSQPIPNYRKSTTFQPQIIMAEPIPTWVIVLIVVLSIVVLAALFWVIRNEMSCCGGSRDMV